MDEEAKVVGWAIGIEKDRDWFFAGSIMDVVCQNMVNSWRFVKREALLDDW